MADLLKMTKPYEPKRTNRWILRFPKEFGIEEWQLKKAARPSYTVKYFSIFGYNFKLKQNWNPITIDFMDPIGPSTTQRLFVLHDFYENNFIHEREIELLDSKSKFKNGFDCELEMLDPTGKEIEKWILKNCKILNYDFGKLSYNSDKMVKPSIIIQPKSVKLLF